MLDPTLHSAVTTKLRSCQRGQHLCISYLLRKWVILYNMRSILMLCDNIGLLWKKISYIYCNIVGDLSEKAWFYWKKGQRKCKCKKRKQRESTWMWPRKQDEWENRSSMVYFPPTGVRAEEKLAGSLPLTNVAAQMLRFVLPEWVLKEKDCFCGFYSHSVPLATPSYLSL